MKKQNYNPIKSTAVKENVGWQAIAAPHKRIQESQKRQKSS